MRKVLVSGGSGYIAGFVIRQLVAEGWHVNLTLREPAREPALRTALGVNDACLEMFSADLMRDDGWAQAVAGCSHVVHLASPLPSSKPQRDSDLIVPARDGALRILRAAQAAGVTRFVMTSSVAAVLYGRTSSARITTEADWTDINGPHVSAYAKSKTIAERAARDVVSRGGGTLEFVTINPSLVLGPLLSNTYSPSLEPVKRLLEGSLPGCPDLTFNIVDVRDVADLHVRALTAPDMAGERFLATGQSVKMIEMAHILKNALGLQARKVRARPIPDFIVKAVGLFDPMIMQVVHNLGRENAMDASHARARLAWVARPARDTIVDCARSLIAQGIVTV